MAYRVLMGRRHPFLLLEGRTGERCAHEAPRRGIRKDGTWYTYGWDLTKNICESARRPPKGRLREQAVRAIGQTRSVCPAGARSREAAPSQVFSSGGTILTARSPSSGAVNTTTLSSAWSTTIIGIIIRMPGGGLVVTEASQTRPVSTGTAIAAILLMCCWIMLERIFTMFLMKKVQKTLVILCMS